VTRRNILLAILFALISPHIQTTVDIVVALHSPAFALVQYFEIRTREIILTLVRVENFFTSFLIALAIAGTYGALLDGKRFLYTTIFLAFMALNFLGQILIHGEDPAFIFFVFSTWSMISYVICCYPASYIGGLIREKYVKKTLHT